MKERVKVARIMMFMFLGYSSPKNIQGAIFLTPGFFADFALILYNYIVHSA